MGLYVGPGHSQDTELGLRFGKTEREESYWLWGNERAAKEW